MPYAGHGIYPKWRDVKQASKALLAKMIAKECGVEFDPSMLFDVQVKRIHEYKRQLLNILRGSSLSSDQQGHTENMVPRCVLIGGKAAPGYFMAKLIIKLASNVAHMVNSILVTPYLRFAFLPNYNVSAMEKSARERIYPSKFRPRVKSIGHGQYEVHDERRTDDWHYGWRQYRDVRGSGLQKLLPVWTQCRAGLRGT